MNSNDLALDTVRPRLSAIIERACDSVTACISDIESGAGIADARVHFQQMFDTLAEMINVDEELRLSLVHTIASLAGCDNLVPIETDRDRLASAAEDQQRASSEFMASFNAAYLKQLPGEVPTRKPGPLLRKLEWYLVFLKQLQCGLDSGEFFLSDEGSSEGCGWTMDNFEYVIAFTRMEKR